MHTLAHTHTHEIGTVENSRESHAVTDKSFNDEGRTQKATVRTIEPGVAYESQRGR